MAGRNLDKIDELNEAGLTMLHEFAISGNPTLVKLWLELGADKNALSKSGKTAKEYARELGWSEIEKVLK
ncbi:hypothetical protein [Campylobacter suis]|uniref:Ankyrin repeat domain-containing protein n=1 Tax=Campylobacter suis TaxID=2790657 RepID=A0ABM8Q8V7_9BACT|nr:hypothetical protein [Campylobacter suis]CAD7289402.1 hypothetical protein LMG8286_01783 [Campylobacter suis]